MQNNELAKMPLDESQTLDESQLTTSYRFEGGKNPHHSMGRLRKMDFARSQESAEGKATNFILISKRTQGILPIWRRVRTVKF